MSNDAKKPEDVDAEFGRQLLITQLNEMSEDWRHLDKRVETALSLYISVLALVVGATAAIYSNGEDLLVPLRSVAFAAVVLVPFGFITAHRVKNAAIARNRRQLSINLIKLFFQKRYPEIEPYLPVYVFTPKLIEGVNDEEKRASEMRQLKPKVPYVMFRSMYVLNGLLVCAAVVGFVGDTLPATQLLALVSGISIYVIQHFIEKTQVVQDYID